MATTSLVNPTKRVSVRRALRVIDIGPQSSHIRNTKIRGIGTCRSSTEASLDSSTVPSDVISKSSSGRVAAFPWRHSPAPLPRLCLPDQGIYEPFGPGGIAGFRSDPKLRLFMSISAMRFLEISWFDVILGKSSWETNLANNFAAAFQTCIGCLFSKIFHVPLQRVVCPSIAATTPKEVKDPGSDMVVSFDSDSLAETDAAKKNNVEKESSKIEEEDDIIDANTLLQMMDTTVFDLYEYQHPSSLSVLLQMQVQSAKLENLHLVPFLTRHMVKQNPALRGSVQAIIRNEVIEGKLKRKSYMETTMSTAENFEGLILKITQSTKEDPEFLDADENFVTLTIVAQVTVMCYERFRVVDVHTGECVQGDSNAKINLVPHLVRFERVIKISDDFKQWYLGSWKITDIDDLLDGNIWY